MNFLSTYFKLNKWSISSWRQEIIGTKLIPLKPTSFIKEDEFVCRIISKGKSAKETNEKFMKLCEYLVQLVPNDQNDLNVGDGLSENEIVQSSKVSKSSEKTQYRYDPQSLES